MIKFKSFIVLIFVMAMLNTSIALASDGGGKALTPLKRSYTQLVESEITKNQTGKAEEIKAETLDKLPIETADRKPLIPVVFNMLKSLIGVVVLILLIAGAIKLFLNLKNKVEVEEEHTLSTEPSNVSEAVSSFVKNNMD